MNRYKEVKERMNIDSDLVEELIFEKGDRVTLNKDITLSDLGKNFWDGAQSSTLNFLSEYLDKNEYVFTVTKNVKKNLTNRDMNSVRLDEYRDDFSSTISQIVLKKVDFKEMTLEEIEEQLGYKIKIVVKECVKE